MPLYSRTDQGDFSIGIWRIGEDMNYFERLFHGHPDIQNTSRRLQWFASRHLANEMLGQPDTIVSNEAGKPNFKNSAHHLSISHTVGFAAVILSHRYAVGIDIEAVHPKVERIAHKFLREDEIVAIHPHEKAAKLMLYWSAKESLFKLYGGGGIEFTTQLLIQPFVLNESGVLKADIVTPYLPMKNLTVHYRFFEGHVLTYVAGI